MLEVGTKAPDFTVPDETGADVRLKDFAGRAWCVLLFPRPIHRLNHRSVRVPRRIQQDPRKRGVIRARHLRGHSRGAEEVQREYDLPYPLLADADKRSRTPSA